MHIYKTITRFEKMLYIILYNIATMLILVEILLKHIYNIATVRIVVEVTPNAPGTTWRHKMLQLCVF